MASGLIAALSRRLIVRAAVTGYARLLQDVRVCIRVPVVVLHVHVLDSLRLVVCLMIPCAALCPGPDRRSTLARFRH